MQDEDEISGSDGAASSGSLATDRPVEVDDVPPTAAAPAAPVEGEQLTAVRPHPDGKVEQLPGSAATLQQRHAPPLQRRVAGLTHRPRGSRFARAACSSGDAVPRSLQRTEAPSRVLGPGPGPPGGLDAANTAASHPSVQRKAGSYAPPAPPMRPNPKADPRFKKVSGELKKTSKQTKSHPPGKAEAKKAADAAVPPANDKQAQAKAGQADKMAGAKKGGFDKAAFIAAVKQAIAAAAPKTLEEADEFADSGKAAGVKDQVMGKVAKGKEDSAKDVAAKTKEAPDPSKATEKPVKPLEPDKEAKPKAPEFAKAMPAKVPAEQTDFDGPKNEVNDKMAEADVSESDLKKSNEPQMMEAAAAKKEGEVLAAKAPKEIRAKEANVLKKAEVEAAQKGKGGVDAMAGAKKNALAQAGAKKNDQKAKDEAKRAQIAAELNKIFDKTKTDVEKILGDLDGKVDEAFTKGEAEVRKAFTAEHKRELEAFKDRRYSGIDGKIQWGIDLFKDLSEVREVKQIYERAKANYEKGMQRVISNVADVVGREIDKAKDRITAGRLEIKDWVTKQPKDIQKLAADAAKGMDERFNQLEADVDAKSQSLAEDLAGKYTAALNEVNKEIEEAQAANKSAWSKAKAAIGDAIEAILKLKDLFLGMLAKAAGAFKKIIADPLKFIGNFMSAVKAGFLGFAERIGEHLKKGLQGWLFGKLAEAGIEIPDKLDLQGIIRMVLSILGLTWGAIRPKIVKVIGEKAMSFLETTAEVFMILVKEGVGGLWKWIADKVGDLKEMVMGQIRDFVITKIVKAGITWVIGMLNPAGALIKIIQTLISVIQWIMEKGAALVELVGTVIDSVSDIANGGMGGVPAKIEGALSKAVPIVISFLASLLGLGGIGDKIKSILDTVRGPVGKAVDGVIGAAVKLTKPIWGPIKKGVNWAKKKVTDAKEFAKKKYEQGKAWMKGKAGAAKEWVKEKLGRKVKPFTMNGHGHDLIFDPGPPVRMLMASNDPIDVHNAIANLLALLQSRDRTADTTGMSPEQAEKAQKAATDQRMAEIQALFQLERQASRLVSMSIDVSLGTVPQSQLDAAMASVAAAIKAYADKYKRNGFTGKDALVTDRVPGLYEGIPTDANHANWIFEDTFRTDLRGACVIETRVRDPKGGEGIFERYYDPHTKQFGLSMAGVVSLAPMVPAEVALGSRGVPTQMFATQRQMKMFEAAAKGDFPPRMGAAVRMEWDKALKGKMASGLADEVKELKWSSIANRLTAIQMTARMAQGEDRDQIVLDTHSYQYALSTLTQAGMMIVPRSVHVVGGHTGFTLGSLPKGNAAKEQEAMMKWGVKLGDPVFSYFDIKAKVVPKK